MSDDYILVRVPRHWVPGWLWRVVAPLPWLAELLSVHDPAECGCPCHGMPGMRECLFCQDP